MEDTGAAPAAAAVARWLLHHMGVAGGCWLVDCYC